MKRKKRLILIGSLVALLGAICGNWSVFENPEDRYLIFSNIEALAETETSDNRAKCTEAGYICLGIDKDGNFGSYAGLSAKQQ